MANDVIQTRDCQNMYNSQDCRILKKYGNNYVNARDKKEGERDSFLNRMA